jgi:hypothetical protein
MPPHLLDDIQVLRDELQHALRQLNSAEPTSELRQWLLVRRIERAEGVSAGQALRRCLLGAIDALAEYNLEGATILRRHYADGAEVHTIARELSLVDGTINKKQRMAVAQLAERLALDERAARAAQQARIGARLEAPTYTRLFGVEAALEQIAAPLQAEGPPWLVAIEGMGGSGKTALADWIVRNRALDGRWEETAWITARQQVLNAGGALRPVDLPVLTPHALYEALYDQLLGRPEQPAPPLREQQRLVSGALKTRQSLVVIDNLESVRGLDTLLDLLRELSMPSKFLLTTRHSLYHAPGVFGGRLPELQRADAVALLRWEGETRNLPHIATAGDDELAAIYAVTGGNPLALRLVAGQTHVHALEDVLANLRQASGKQAEALYTYLYRQAWEQLDENSRQVLLLLPLASESGARIDFLSELSGLPGPALADALEQLVTLNLVDSRGSLRERSYSIHSLTRTFLLQQVLQW